jgi:hypothetical protein
MFDRVDRETRNLFASVPILTRALRAGIEVHFAAEKLLLDPRDPNSLDRYLDKADESRAYVKAISNSWRRVHHNRAKAGKHPTKQNLWAFRYDGELRIPDEATMPMAHEAIKMFLRDKFLSAVVRWLQKDCGATALNSPSALRRWLENPALKGETHACGEIIRHEGLISSPEWDEVQLVLKENRGRRAPRKGYLPIPFRCGCGARMKADKHGARIYVHCSRCHKPYLRLDRLLPMLSYATMAYVADKRDLLNDSVVKAEIRDRTLADLQELSKAKSRLKDQWQSLLDQKIGWRGPKDIVNEKEESLVSQQATLDEKENRLLDEIKEIPEIQVVDIQKAWENVIEPYEVHFTQLSPTPPTLDERKPDEFGLKLLLQGQPSSFHRINNIKPLYLSPMGGPKPGEGCVIPMPPVPPSMQGTGTSSVWSSNEFNPQEQFKSAIPLDSWVWNFLRDLKAEALVENGRVKLRFHLKVLPRRPNKTPCYISPGSRPETRPLPAGDGRCCRRH